MMPEIGKHGARGRGCGGGRKHQGFGLWRRCLPLPSWVGADRATRRQCCLRKRPLPTAYAAPAAWEGARETGVSGFVGVAA